MYRRTAPPSSFLSDLRILYVDDSAESRALFAEALARAGADVTTAGSAHEALVAFDALRPELIVSDVARSDADGLSLVRSIRDRSPETGGDTPAIALTRGVDRRPAIEAGFTEHLTKPIEFPRLFETISRFQRQIEGGRARRLLRGPFGNDALDALDPQSRAVISDLLELGEMTRGETLVSPGDAPRYLYFPRFGIVSLLRVLEAGKTVEVCPVGRNGVVGLACLHGADSASHWACVLVAGGVWRVARAELARAMEDVPALRSSLLRHAYAQFAEISLVAACTRAHTIDQQVARWLLTVADRASASDLPLTHERIADRLGTRRSSVSLALEAYRRDGRIDMSRGRVAISDRRALEAAACECYRTIQSQYERPNAA
jgi:CheY-like chemotaxis protein